MSSGFVSGGTADAPIERSDEWLAAQEELEATRRRKAEELRQSGGRSLYETLEANKGTFATLPDPPLPAPAILLASSLVWCHIPAQNL